MKKITTVCLILLSLLIATKLFLWASSPFIVYLEGNRTELHPVILEKEIYLPLSEVSNLFHLKTLVNWQNQTIVFSSPQNELDTSETKTSAPASTNQVILGEIKIAINSEIQKGGARIKVKLLKETGSYDAEIHNKAIEAWLRRNDTFFTDTHAQVAETVTDSGGYFAFSKIPPGSYELVAFIPITSVKLGYWWVPVHIGKETEHVIFDNQNLQTISLLQDTSR